MAAIKSSNGYSDCISASQEKRLSGMLTSLSGKLVHLIATEGDRPLGTSRDLELEVRWFAEEVRLRPSIGTRVLRMEVDPSPYYQG